MFLVQWGLRDASLGACPEATQMLEGRLALATSAADIGVWDIDMLTGVLSWDDTMHRIFDLPKEEFSGTYENWRNSVLPDDIDSAEAKFQAALNSGRPFDDEFRIVHKDGSIRTMKARAQVFLNDEGQAVRAVGVNIDVTEQKAIELAARNATEALEQAHARLSRLADNAPGALFEYRQDRDGRINFPYFSANLSDLIGVSDHEIVADGVSAFKCMHPDDVGWFLELVEKTRTDLSHFTARYRLNHPTKGARWIMVSSIPIPQDDGATIRYGNLFDVTEQALAERRSVEAAAEVQEAHQRLSIIANLAPVGLYEFRRDPGGRVSFPYCSDRFLQLMCVGRAALAVDATSAFDQVHPEDLPGFLVKIEDSAEKLATFEARFRIIGPDGTNAWVSVISIPRKLQSGAIVWTGALIDITKDVERERTLEETHERLSMIANVVPVGLYEFTRDLDGEMRFPYCSDRFVQQTGLGREDVAKDAGAAFALIHPDDLGAAIDDIDQSAKTLEQAMSRFRMTGPDGKMMWVSLESQPRRLSNGTVSWTGAMIDITKDVEREDALKEARRKAERIQAENEHQALHDGLTGLPNRRYYDKEFNERLDKAKNGGAPDLILVRVDLDHFKHVNDTLGHEAGDMVLIRVAAVLRDSFGDAHFVARIGGDEFSILIAPGTSQAAAVDLIEKAKAVLAEPMTYEDRPCRFGASFGLARTDALAETGEDLQLFADAALYRAKDLGRSRLELFTPSLHREILANRRLAVELDEALEQRQFLPYFQPQVCAETGALHGIEVLLRWDHPQKGIQEPGSFLDVAGQLRIIPDIDRCMMEMCQGSLRRWEAQGLAVPKISFNVSSGRMHDPRVLDLAKAMTGGNTRVSFELLESILIEEESDVFRFHLDQLREAGIEIEIDDFGSGHASILSVLESAPDALKIDRRIIRPIEMSEKSRNLVRAIVEIADTLGIETIAEGVETPGQRQILAGLGCKILQGYLFSRPISEDGLSAYLREGLQKSA